MKTIPSEQVSRLGIHFSFSEVKILPDTVFCDLITKGKRGERISGEIILRARNVQVSPCLVGLITNNLKSVYCNGQWVQHPSDKEKDFYRTHFLFVKETERDDYLAMKHNAEISVSSLQKLTEHTWDVVVWQNDIGKFDIFCTQPSLKRANSVLIFDQESLRCTE